MAAKRGPEARARALLERFNVTAPPVPVRRIAHLMGAQIRLSPLDDELSGMIFVKDGVPIIGVNALHHPNRQRFTIAHEIAHLELHRQAIETEVHVDKTFPVLMRGPMAATGTDALEREANLFAAELLMPRDFLERALAGQAFDIDDERPLEDLARKFRVSKQALEYRIRNLT